MHYDLYRLTEKKCIIIIIHTYKLNELFNILEVSNIGSKVLILLNSEQYKINYNITYDLDV